jgi:cation diffusion facilitator family transporter
MKDQPKRIAIIRRASWIALVGNGVLSLSKILAGLVSGSLSVLSDGIDSATDVFIATVTLFAAKVSGKPGDKEHPYGHGRIETVSAALISFIVFFAGAQLLLSAFKGIFSGAKTELPSIFALWVTLASIFGKILLAWSQFHYGKLSNSSMLIANGKNMQGDVVTSIAVLLGLSITYITGIPIMDRVFAALVSLWIIKNAVGIFIEANTELMDGTQDHGPYEDIFNALDRIPEAGNPHKVRLRKVGSMLMVDLDIEVDESLSVRQAHAIAKSVESAIKQELPDVYDVIVHVEPRGNVEDEKFGLSAEDHNR